MHDHSVDDSRTKHDRLSDTCSDTVNGHGSRDGSTGDTRHVNITENCQLMTLFNNYLASSDR